MIDDFERRLGNLVRSGYKISCCSYHLIGFDLILHMVLLGPWNAMNDSARIGSSAVESAVDRPCRRNRRHHLEIKLRLHRVNHQLTPRTAPNKQRTTYNNLPTTTFIPHFSRTVARYHIVLAMVRNTKFWAPLAALAALAPLVSADVKFTIPKAGTVLDAGTTITVQWEESKTEPLITDLLTYQLFLCWGSNDVFVSSPTARLGGLVSSRKTTDYLRRTAHLNLPRREPKSTLRRGTRRMAWSASRRVVTRRTHSMSLYF
jgi:hypothetical protein